MRNYMKTTERFDVADEKDEGLRDKLLIKS